MGAVRGLSWEHRLELALAQRGGLMALALCFTAAASALALTDRGINDEGMLSYLGARYLVSEPLPMLFFQKFRPLAILPYALVAWQGLTAFLIAHVGVAAAGVVLLADVAKRLGLTLVNVPALLLACSPLYFTGAASGLSNVDAVVAGTLMLSLFLRRRILLAGVALGCLPWIRYELSLLCLVFGVYVLIWDAGRWRFLLGVLAFPLVYLLAGSAYHHDALWLLHYPPTLIHPPDNPVWHPAPSPHTTADLVRTLLQVTPAVLLAPFVAWRQLSALERALLCFVIINHLAMTLTPNLGLLNFDRSPRYSMQSAPALALLAGRALDQWWHQRKLPFENAALMLLLVLGLVANLQVGTSGWLVGLLVLALAVLLTRVGRHRGAVVLLAVAVLAAPVGAVAAPKRELVNLARAADYLVDHGASFPVVTNVKQLATMLERRGADSKTVRYALSRDQYYELTELTNPNNQQRDVVRALVREELYGQALFPDELRPELLPAGTRLVLTDDPRLDLIMPPKLWSSRLKPVERYDRVRIFELQPSERAK